MSSKKDILIIGAGTFGLSTALELLRRGETNVRLIDPYEIPSPLSAGNDVNKIFQSTVDDGFYSDLALEALDMWRNDPVYKKAFHETGIIYAASGKKIQSIKSRYEYLTKRKEKVLQLTEPEEFSSLIRFKDHGCSKERFKNWYGYHQQENCGWTFAALALKLVAEECSRLGAKFIVDSAEELLFNESNDCIGVRTFSGQILKADTTVICAGANSFKFLDFNNQLLAKCWAVCHIKLTEEEAKLLKGLPVVLNLDQGFLFEPDSNNELKLCNEFPGYINMVSGSSVPVYRNQIPVEAEAQMRNFLKQVFPSLSTRPFSVAKICWCTDTPDRHFLICDHPDHKGLVLGTGDSGQGFKYMPNVGIYISDVITNGDSSLKENKRRIWRWRPEIGNSRDMKDIQNRYGGSNMIKDLHDITKWTDGTNYNSTIPINSLKFS